jgi:hypothetical protein
MDIRVRARDDRADEAVADHARRRLYYALMHRSDHVERVDVRFGGAAAPRRPQGRYCVIRVQLAGLPAATIVSIATSEREAIDGAADRAGGLVNGQILAAGRAIAGAGTARRRAISPEP